MRARMAATLAAVVTFAASPAPARAAEAGCARTPWPEWEQFARRFVQDDGRVINRDLAGEPTVSEGQAYALFFALVADDRTRFPRILAWTRDNLADGDLTVRLPAWKWGRADDGKWGVLDANSAADADLWLAYVLLEAGRLWSVEAWRGLGLRLAWTIARREVADIPGLGPMLLPGEQHFSGVDGLWRLNPSYLPLPLLRRLAVADPNGPWKGIAVSTVRLVRAASPHGFVPDWIGWHESKGVVPDPEHGTRGSFDAIRVYLWAGLTDPGDPARRALLEATGGMERSVAIRGAPPREVDTASGAVSGTGPLGFSASLLPYLRARRLPEAAARENARVTALWAPAAGQRAPGYYDSALALFARGFTEGRYRFDKQGNLLPLWRPSCATAAPPSSLH